MAHESAMQQLLLDPPVQLVATYRMDLGDRRYLDEQVRFTQKALHETALVGYDAHWAWVDPAAGAVVKGDALCLSSTGDHETAYLRRADTAALLDAGTVAGIAVGDAAPGGRVLVATAGHLPRSLTGLAILGYVAYVRVTPAGRLEQTTTPTGEMIVGRAEASGRMTISLGSEASGGSLATVNDWKESARFCVTSALPAHTRTGNTIEANANGAFPTVDGVTAQVGDRFVHAVGTDLENGLWAIVSLGSAGTKWRATRTTDADSSGDVTAGLRVGVTEGTNNKGVWQLITADPIALNTTPLTFQKDSSLPAGSAFGDIMVWNGTSWTTASGPAAELTQLTWFIDSAGGDDTAAGDTAPTALATWGEFARRCEGRTFSGDVSVTIVAGSTFPTETLRLGCVLKRGKQLTVRATGTTVASGTVTSFTQINGATSTPALLTSASIADFSPHLERRIRITSGAASGACSTICKAPAANQARIGLLISEDGTRLVPAPGDSFVIETLPTTFHNADIEVSGGGGDGALWKPKVLIVGVRFDDQTYSGSRVGEHLSFLASDVWIVHSQIVYGGAGSAWAGWTGGTCTFIGCMNSCTWALRMRDAATWGHVDADGFITVTGGQLTIAEDQWHQAGMGRNYAGLQVTEQGNIGALAAVGFDLEAGGTALHVEHSACVTCGTAAGILWDAPGSAQAYGLRMQADCQLEYITTPTLGGSTYDALIGTQGKSWAEVAAGGGFADATRSAVAAPVSGTATAWIGNALATTVTVGAGTKATAGDIRFGSSWSIQQRNAEPGTASRNVLSGTGESIVLGDAAQTGTVWLRTAGYVQAVASTGIVLDAGTHLWRDVNGAGGFSLQAAGGSITATNTCYSFGLYQADLATNGATGNTLTIRAQNATGTTSTGGALDLGSGSGTSADGVINIKSGATTLGAIHRAASTYWGFTAYGSGAVFYANGAGQGIIFQAAAANGYVNFATDTLTFGSNAAAYTLTFAGPGTSVTISQGAHATLSRLFTVQAGDVATGTGSELRLKSGTGSVAPGAVTLYAGATQTASLGLAAGDFIALGAAPATAGRIRWSHASQIKARTFDNTGDRNVIDYGATLQDYITVGDDSVAQVWLRTATSGSLLCGGATTWSWGSGYIVFEAVTAYTRTAWNLVPLSSAVTGHGITIQAGDGAAAYNGGALTLASGAMGAGGVTHGALYLRVGGASGQIVGAWSGGSSDYIAFGATPASAGKIRFSHANFDIKLRNITNTADLNIVTIDAGTGTVMSFGDPTLYVNVNAGGGVYVNAGALVLRTSAGSQAALFNCNSGAFEWASAYTAALSQAARPSDLTPQNFTINPQAPWASATGVNRTPGSLVVALAAPTNSGTTEGDFRVTRAGTAIASIRAYDAAPSTYAGFWLNPALTVTSSNFTLLATATSVFLNAPDVGGSILFNAGNTGIAQLSYTGALTWGATHTVTLNQTTHADTPHTFTIQAAHVTTGTGSDLLLQSGNGSVADGTIRLLLGNAGGYEVYVRPSAPFGGPEVYTVAGNAAFTVHATGHTYIRSGGTSGQIYLDALGSDGLVYLRTGGSAVNSLIAGPSDLKIGVPLVQFGAGVVDAVITQTMRASDAVPYPLLIQAQAAKDSAVTNKTGAALNLRGGDKATGGTSVMVGPVNLAANGGNIGLFTEAGTFGAGAGVIAIAACTTVPNTGSVATVLIYRDSNSLVLGGGDAIYLGDYGATSGGRNHKITSTVFSFFSSSPSPGDDAAHMLYIAEVFDLPATDPTGGFDFYCHGGAPAWWTTAGDEVRFTSTSSATASNGAGQTAPSEVAEYLVITFNGNVRKIPLYPS